MLARAAPYAVILVPPTRYSRDSGDDELGDAGIQYNMPAIADSLLAFWIPDTMKNIVAGAPYFSIVRE